MDLALVLSAQRATRQTHRIHARTVTRRSVDQLQDASSYVRRRMGDEVPWMDLGYSTTW
jgi:hypothetical protein